MLSLLLVMLLLLAVTWLVQASQDPIVLKWWTNVATFTNAFLVLAVVSVPVTAYMFSGLWWSVLSGNMTPVVYVGSLYLVGALGLLLIYRSHKLPRAKAYATLMIGVMLIFSSIMFIEGYFRQWLRGQQAARGLP